MFDPSMLAALGSGGGGSEKNKTTTSSAMGGGISISRNSYGDDGFFSSPDPIPIGMPQNPNLIYGQQVTGGTLNPAMLIGFSVLLIVLAVRKQ